MNPSENVVNGDRGYVDNPDVAALAQALAGGMALGMIPDDYPRQALDRALGTAGKARTAALQMESYHQEHPYDQL